MDCREGVLRQRNSGSSLWYEKEVKMREVGGRRIRGANLYVSLAYERPPHTQHGQARLQRYVVMATRQIAVSKAT